MTADAYGSSTLRRVRRTNAELQALDVAIVEAVTLEYPVTLHAIAPSYLRALLSAAIGQHGDPERLRLTRSVERSEREGLAAIVSGGLR